MRGEQFVEQMRGAEASGIDARPKNTERRVRFSAFESRRRSSHTIDNIRAMIQNINDEIEIQSTNLANACNDRDAFFYLNTIREIMHDWDDQKRKKSLEEMQSMMTTTDRWQAEQLQKLSETKEQNEKTIRELKYELRQTLQRVQLLEKPLNTSAELQTTMVAEAHSQEERVQELSETKEQNEERIRELEDQLNTSAELQTTMVTGAQSQEERVQELSETKEQNEKRIRELEDQLNTSAELQTTMVAGAQSQQEIHRVHLHEEQSKRYEYFYDTAERVKKLQEQLASEKVERERQTVSKQRVLDNMKELQTQQSITLLSLQQELEQATQELEKAERERKTERRKDVDFITQTNTSYKRVIENMKKLQTQQSITLLSLEQEFKETTQVLEKQERELQKKEKENELLTFKSEDSEMAKRKMEIEITGKENTFRIAGVERELFMSYIGVNSITYAGENKYTVKSPQELLPQKNILFTTNNRIQRLKESTLRYVDFYNPHDEWLLFEVDKSSQKSVESPWFGIIMSKSRSFFAFQNNTIVKIRTYLTMPRNVNDSLESFTYIRKGLETQLLEFHSM